MKKVIVLIISILLPIIAAVAIGVYGYEIRYVPSSNSEISGKFIRDMNKGVITSEGRIENYRKLENYYYEEDPIFKKDIVNKDGERLMTLVVYRNLCIYQPTANSEAKLKTLFEIFAYNINYTEIKKYFILDNMEIIEKAGMPTFEVTFTPTNNRDPFTIVLSNRSNVVIPDYQSIPEYADEENETRNYIQSEVFREYESANNLAKFSDDVNITVKAFLKITNEDESSTTLEAEDLIAEEYIADFKHKGEEINKDDLKVGYRASSVDDTYYNAGFKMWLFKKYIWWECLIGFVLVGFISGTFALIYNSEETEKQKSKKKRR